MSGNFLNPVLGFLATTTGQFALSGASVFAVIAIHSAIKPTSDRFVSRDDWAIGFDLLILALITLVAGGVTAHSMEAAVQASAPNAAAAQKAALSFADKQSNIADMAGVLLGLIVVLIFRAQRAAWMTQEQRDIWSENHPPRETDKPRTAPRLTLITGIYIPAIAGFFALFEAVRTVA